MLYSKAWKVDKAHGSLKGCVSLLLEYSVGFESSMNTLYSVRYSAYDSK